MIGLLHGYGLEGSGSNLWTRYMARSLCRMGETLHLICQESSPEKFDFISEAYLYPQKGKPEKRFHRETPYKGKCICHKIELGEILPVYVADPSAKNSRAVPMVNLTDEQIEDYLQTNTDALLKIIKDFKISSLHANHAVLISVVAERMHDQLGIPFVIMPHGSAIEYVVKPDPRFLKMATAAFAKASGIFFVGTEMKNRIKDVFSSLPDLEKKMHELNLGVDTELFTPSPRNQRRENIENLKKALAENIRGKTLQQEERLKKRLTSPMTEEEFKRAMADTFPRFRLTPDEHIETKLDSIDWENDSIVLFLGRLIANKGLQTLIAGLPLIFERSSKARLLIVGHGPLREVMEAWIWALQNGEKDLVEKIPRWGSPYEDFPSPFDDVLLFFEALKKEGQFSTYLEKAKEFLKPNKILFLGYLKHPFLRHLLPCANVAVFPSLIPEAGPLVFLESLAAGCFPVGTYFGGMAASIDTTAKSLPKETAEWMKISPHPSEIINDLIKRVPKALAIAEEQQKGLRQVAEERFDWHFVAKRWKTLLDRLTLY